MRASSSLTAAATLLFVVHFAHAQAAQATVSVTAGSATDVLGVTSRAATITPALAFAPNPNAAFTFSASGTRFDNQQWSASGAAAAALRAPLTRRLAGTLNADASMMRTSYQFSYNTAGVTPALELTVGPFTAYGGARAVVGNTTTVRESRSAGGIFGSPVVSPTSVSSSRTSLGGLAGTNVSIATPDGETLVLGARIERGRIDSIAQLDRTATLAAYSGRLGVESALGLRSEPGASAMFGSLGLSFAVSSAMSLELSGGSYPANRLIGTPAGRFMNIGASLRTRRSQPHQPEATGVPSTAAGMTRLTLKADDVTRVDVAGDFTNWQPIAAHRAGNGVWYVDLRIPPGQYRYAFRVNGSKWTVPSGVAVVDDDFGGKAAWLVVSTP